jgi:hypothetical protein
MPSEMAEDNGLELAPLGVDFSKRKEVSAAVRYKDIEEAPTPVKPEKGGGGSPIEREEVLELAVPLSSDAVSLPSTPKLELAMEVRRRSVEAPSGTLYATSSRRVGPLRRFMLVLVLVAAGFAAWRYQHLWIGFFTSQTEGEPILLLIETDPRDADVFVDGVLQVTKPIRLPRGDRLFSIQVQASGYITMRQEVTADRTRSISIKLRRRPRQE